METTCQQLNVPKGCFCRTKKGNVCILIFLTDGAPSDYPPRGTLCGTEMYHERDISNHIAAIFGSRLTIGAIAVGDGRYRALAAMIDSAKDYNCQTFLRKLLLNAEDISSAFIKMSSLISLSKSRATDILTNHQRTFQDLIREPQSSVSVYLPHEKEWIRYIDGPHERILKKTLFGKYKRIGKPTESIP
mmetsp:Transcript_19886/g.36215  ORF Transcript_19886/g.36215 Transcript_19886/m.36215 type:complete len:189 (+) Transcript_19886:84-650(+)